MRTRIALRVAALVAGMLCAGAAVAASQVIIQKGDGQDQILTITGDDGATTHSITIVCEYPKLEYGFVIQSPQAGPRLRLKADGASVSAGKPLVAGGSATFLLKGRAGQNLFNRVTAAKIVEVESGGARMRFRLSDGAAVVARFRQLCGL